MARIIRIVTGNDGGGVRTSELMYGSALRERGFEVFGVILGEGKSSEAYRKSFDRYIELDSLPKFDGTMVRKAMNTVPILAHAVRESNRAKAFVEEVGGAVAVTTRQQPTLLVGALLARALGKELYWHAPGPMKGGMQKVFLGLAKRINRIKVIPNSRYTAAQLRVGAGDVVYPGFDPQRLVNDRPGRYRKMLGIPEGKALYVVVARVNYEKASDLVVEGFVGSRPFEDGAHLVMAGDADRPEFLNRVKEYAELHGGGQVHMLEFVEDVGNLIGDSDVVINGRRGAEPFGISIVEALGSGKPVIALGKGGPEETVRDGMNGWLVEHPTASGYRGAFDRSWEDRDRWAEFGRSGKEFSKQFAIDEQVERYLSVIGVK